ncbi:hypothetical protein XOC_0191 [Xanthomonas oryzae pv. oryzicola BLS256]|uniref:Uncharacterized protein n=1 Tax=Xanthomonas oryzae pv. oryzicola (strain BLS256) TaxID=383407 RepID=G7TJN7_XANOB|nr:hypothetical protein XOC_0191 [Xanthomonas oryzae pv. oryzicola BLS256]
MRSCCNDVACWISAWRTRCRPPQAGGGDRRYFSIVWDGASEPLRIPQEHAPAEIVRRWKQGTL